MTRFPDMNLRHTTTPLDLLIQIHPARLPRRPSAQITTTIRRRPDLEIRHLIIFAQLGARALDAQVEQKREDGGEGPRDGERGQGFVEPADHDAGLVVPAADDAAVAERPG